jgi:hypothetical protein
MKFSCPKCGRDEEIILDRKPWCRHCFVLMIPPSDYSQLWMSPYIAIRRMSSISEKHGIERARKDGQFKKEREAWTTAVLALAISKLQDKEWWVEIETIENTPDTKLHHIDQSSGHNVDQMISIEVVDWEENVPDIMEVIEKKCKRAYPSHYLLVVHARNPGKVLDLGKVIDSLEKIRSPFLEIWVVAPISSNQLKVVQLAPRGPEIDLDLRTELEKASQQRQFLKKGIRGTNIEFQDLGTVYLSIP